MRLSFCTYWDAKRWI